MQNRKDNSMERVVRWGLRACGWGLREIKEFKEFREGLRAFGRGGLKEFREFSEFREGLRAFRTHSAP